MEINFKNILIIAAHPDDDILGCGAAINKFQSTKTKINVLFIAEGTSCRYKHLHKDTEKIKKDIEIRNNFAKKSLKYLKVNKYKFLNLPCGRLDTMPLIEITKKIEQYINQIKPDTVFTHSNLDNHNDHRIVSRATMQATRPNVLNQVKNVIFYEVPSSSEWSFVENFNPNFFLSLSEKNLNAKIRAMNIYKTEIKKYPFPRSKEGIKSFAMYRGMQSGNKYAEAFKIVRISN